MRFAVPVNSSSEVRELYRSGADELYCGYFDSGWQSAYGRHDSINRRQGEANYSSWSDLEKTVFEASGLGLPVYLAVNSRYTSAQYDTLTELIDRWRSIGGSGVIIRDIGLLSRMKENDLTDGLKITASLLFPVLNGYAADMLKEYGVSRVVLPRCLSIDEMRAVCLSASDVEYEAMIFGDKCRFIDGYCRSIHAESSLSAFSKNRFSDIDFSKGCVHLCMQYGKIPDDPCAVCRLAELEEAGVSVGKLGGRGLPLSKRIQWLRFIKESQGLSEVDKKILYRHTFSHPCSCYYVNKPSLCYPPGGNVYLPDNMIGHHSCPYALEEIKAYLCGENIDKNVYVIPPVTPDHADAFEEVISLIIEKHGDDAEIVLNDYGALSYCLRMKDRGELKAKLTTGLLLSGQDTDPYYGVLNGREDCDTLAEHLSEPSVISQKELLHKSGVDGIELCRQPVWDEELISSLEGLDIRIYDFSVLSVKLCCGDCENCREKAVVRNGKTIISNRNMLYYHPDTNPCKHN